MSTQTETVHPCIQGEHRDGEVEQTGRVRYVYPEGHPRSGQETYTAGMCDRHQVLLCQRLRREGCPEVGAVPLDALERLAQAKKDGEERRAREAADRFKATGFLESDNTPMSRAADSLERIDEAVGALQCPYFRGEGTCVTGCGTSGPECWDAGNSVVNLGQSVTTLVKELERVLPGLLHAVTDQMNQAYVDHLRASGQPVRWLLPAEPGREVTHIRDRTNRVWRRPSSGSGRNWQTVNGRLGCPWPEIINGYGPLTDVSAEYAR